MSSITTLSLYEALHTRTGKVHGKTAARHASVEFVAFLREIVATRPANKRSISFWTTSRLIKLNSCWASLMSSNVHLHFTPTYSPWLNQVEIWFSRIEREVISRGVFSSVSDLARKLKRYICAYSAHAKPFKWKYSDPTHHRLRSLCGRPQVTNPA